MRVLVALAARLLLDLQTHIFIQAVRVALQQQQTQAALVAAPQHHLRQMGLLVEQVQQRVPLAAAALLARA
jgi:hypothetical protein